MAPRKPNTNIDGRALQWSDLGTQGKQVVSHQMNELGKNLTRVTADAIEKNKIKAENPDVNPQQRTLASRKARVNSEVLPHLRDKAVTLDGAAGRRVSQYHDAVHAADARGEQIPAGAGWYFSHHADISGVAKTHGFDSDRAIVASAVMSPQNSPDNEKAAVRGLMEGHAQHSVHLSQEVANHLVKNGVPVNPAHVGQTVPIRALHPHALAAMSDTKIRGKVSMPTDPQGTVLKDVARGGTKGNIKQAADVLHGNTDQHTAIDPHSAPKVWSYAQNIREAHPNTAEHVEYMTRVAHHAGVETGRLHPGQQLLDLYGKQHDATGMLSPTRSTAEDTWQNSMTMGQANKTVNRANVMKHAGSMDETYGSAVKKKAVLDPKEGKPVSAHPDSRIGPSALQHAYNNEATVRAASKMSKGSGVQLPSVAAQEIPWTQVRRATGKDPEWNNRPQEPKANENISSQQFKGQGKLF